MFGVDPNVLAAFREVGNNVSGKITVDYAENSIKLQLSGELPQAKKGIAYIMDQFPMAFARQLEMFFGIRGQIAKKNEESKIPVEGPQ